MYKVERVIRKRSALLKYRQQKSHCNCIIRNDDIANVKQAYEWRPCGVFMCKRTTIRENHGIHAVCYSLQPETLYLRDMHLCICLHKADKDKMYLGNLR